MKTLDEAVLPVYDEVHVSATQTNEKNKDNFQSCEWLLDSGATSHMTGSKVMFDRLEKDVRSISLADKKGKKLISDGRGEIVVKQDSNDGKIRLKNVLCVPDINMNLLSVAKITDYGYNVKFNKHSAVVYRNNNDIKTAVRKENAYCVRSSIIKMKEQQQWKT